MKIPAGLRHLLDVYKLVNDSRYSYPEAFKKVASKGRITEASVRSACTRDIQINTEELTYYLDPANSESFKSHLSKRYPAYQDFLCQFIDGVTGKTNSHIDNDPARIVKTLYDDEKKNLYIELTLISIIDTFKKWLLREDLPFDIKAKMQNWVQSTKIA